MPYYGLYIPVKGGGSGTTTNDANTPSSATATDAEFELLKARLGVFTLSAITLGVPTLVFQDKQEVLKVLKQHKDARFKEFLNEDDAVKYAQTGFEVVQNKYNDTKTPTESLEKSAFRAPTKGQFVQFRRFIEMGDWQRVKKIVYDNPRYLVSVGDTPTILKEGYRYNAMHVCALNKRHMIASIILETVSDPEFVERLMGKKNNEKTCKELCEKLLDYYLNMPEKGRCDTPLHIACKYGCVAIVEMLINYPQCKILQNNLGQLPQNVICDRGGNYSDEKKIKRLFEDRYYVPVLRCNDNSIPGQIGEPFSVKNPPSLNCEPLSPKMEIKALAGPMRKDEAKLFFRRWKTPPRIGSNVSSPIACNPCVSPIKSFNSTPIKTMRIEGNCFRPSTAMPQRRSLFNSTPHRKDRNDVIESNGYHKFTFDDSIDDSQNGNYDKKVQEKGSVDKIETNNNNNLGKTPNSQLNMLKTALCPRTPSFLAKNSAFSTYRDQKIDSPIVDSMQLLQEENDSLLNVSDVFDSPSFKERHVKNIDPEKGIECIGRVLAKENDIEWREYWDFLDEFLDIASEYGIGRLEMYLAQRQKEQDERNNKLEQKQKPDVFDDFCNALENALRISDDAASATTTKALTSSTHQSTTPYTYVEKSLQVHARRMTKTIIHNIDNEVSIKNFLLVELRRVKSLIYSFKEDASYTNVNFEKVHSRIGNLISMFLQSSQKVSEQMREKILVLLQKLSEGQGERHKHMECVCSHIFQALQHLVEQVQPENVKTEEMCSKIWSQEKDCDCQWECNLSRKTSRRNRMEARYKNHQRLKQQEKVEKDANNQQQLNQSTEEEEWADTMSVLNDLSEEYIFCSDFVDSDNDENEVFLTPRESPSRIISSDDLDDDNNKIYIYGNEPSKRDLDVLSAIFHVDIDKTKYPNIHSWKSIVMSYSNDELEYLPSPLIVKKTHSFVATSANRKNDYSRAQSPSSMQPAFLLLDTSTFVLNSPRQQSPLATTPIEIINVDFD